MNTIPPAFAEREFRKATASDPQKSCVRVARRDSQVEIRDDKVEFGAPGDHRLHFTDTEFDAFLTAARSGQTAGTCLEIVSRDDMLIMRASATPEVELVFTEAEIVAFYDGIAKHEFDAPAFA